MSLAHGPDAPTFIETQFPVSRLSKESYKERKANYSQTLTGLGKWWGRKPLVLVRAVILGLLMPASGDPRKDREVFLALLTMDDEGLRRRKSRNIPLKEMYRRGRASALVYAHVHGGGAQAQGHQGRRQAGGAGADAGAPVRAHELRREAALVRSAGASRWAVPASVGSHQRPSRYECRLPAGAGAGVGRAALRARAAGGGCVLRRRQRALRGGAHRLQSLRVGLEPGRRVAHLGRAQHRRRRREGGQGRACGTEGRVPSGGRAGHRVGHRARRARLAGRRLPVLHRNRVPGVRLAGSAGAELGDWREVAHGGQAEAGRGEQAFRHRHPLR